jgi:hypothetical protein
MVRIPFPEGERNTRTLQSSTEARDDRSLPICQKPDADGGLSPPFWNWLRHQVTLTCRLIHAPFCLGKRMGAQRDRGAGTSEATGRRLCCLSTANPDVHTKNEAPKMTSMPNIRFFDSERVFFYVEAFC